MLITYHIEVTPGGNARVTAHPRAVALKKGEEFRVQFTSNDAITVLRVGTTSPFVEEDLQAGKLIKVGTAGAGPFKAVSGPHSYHLDCGFINPVNGEFATWGDTPGVIVPENDGGSGDN